MPMDLRGTEFRKRCWNELLRIPYGETRTYAEIAPERWIPPDSAPSARRITTIRSRL